MYFYQVNSCELSNDCDLLIFLNYILLSYCHVYLRISLKILFLNVELTVKIKKKSKI